MSRRCVHRSHRLRLPCLRPRTYDGLCARHNGTCFLRCPGAVREPSEFLRAMSVGDLVGALEALVKRARGRWPGPRRGTVGEDVLDQCAGCGHVRYHHRPECAHQSGWLGRTETRCICRGFVSAPPTDRGADRKGENRA